MSHFHLFLNKTFAYLFGIETLYGVLSPTPSQFDCQKPARQFQVALTRHQKFPLSATRHSHKFCNYRTKFQLELELGTCQLLPTFPVVLI